MRILLVDDEQAVRWTLSLYLERLDHVVSVAEDGLQGLEQARTAGPFDAIISDCRMPHLSGPEMATQLRAEGDRTPILFVGGAFEEDLEGMEEALAPIARVRKPYRMSDLVQVLEGLLAGTVS